MAKIKIGWSEVALLPEGVKVSLAGQFYERVSDTVESPLTVTALAIECGGESAVFCSCDLVSTSHKLLTTVRSLLRDRPDFPADQLILSAIHTHTAPVYANRTDSLAGSFRHLSVNEALQLVADDVCYRPLVEEDGTFTGDEAHLFLAQRIAEAALTAWDKRKIGSFAAGFGRAAVGMCRRVSYDDGSAKMWGDTDSASFTELEGGNDSGIELLYLFDETDTLTGVVANVACPAQVLEHHSFLSSDYWGKVKHLLRQEWGEELYVLGLCSAAGDQCPRDMIRFVPSEKPICDPNIVRENPVVRRADPSMFDLSGCWLVARRIANEILYAREGLGEAVKDTVLSHVSEMLPMPVRRVTMKERDEALIALRRFVEENGKVIDYQASAQLHVHTGTLNRFRLQQTTDTVNWEVHFLRLGDVAFATSPVELFLDYGNQIRARSRAKQTFLIQLCCGSWGYLPTEKAEKSGHYSAYVSSGTVGHEGGALLVRRSVQAIRDLFRDEPSRK